MAGLLGAYFGNPNLQRQGARARALAKQRDVNLLADPKTYAVVQGLLGTPPDQLGFSVLNPKYQEIKQVAEPAFYAGSLLQVAPATAPAVNRIAQAVGPKLEQTLLPAFEAGYNRGGLTREMVEAMGTNTVSPMFIGASSPSFNKDMALKASQMAKKGATPQEIWQTTGTVKGPDGQWRQEISDNKVRYEKAFEESPAGQSINTFVGDAIDHPELFKAYPQSPNIALGMYPSAANASYQPAANKIVIPNRGESGKSSLLHEIQHSIQEKEGFAVGGNFRDFAKIQQEAEQQIGVLNNQMRELVKVMDSPSISKQDKEVLSSQYENLMNQRMSLVKDAQIDPMQAYGNLMGEAEARLTQRRMNLNPEQRVQNFPFEYTGETGYGLDVPLEGLIYMTPEGTIIKRGLLDR